MTALVSSQFPPTSETAGLFEADVDLVAGWLLNTLSDSTLPGESYIGHQPDPPDISEGMRQLLPLTSLTVRRHLLIPIEGWTLLFNNSNLGTDLGVLPLKAVPALKCRVLHVMDVPDVPLRFKYGAVSLTVYDQDSSPPLYIRRAISAANDAGRWSFDESGEPFDFEDRDAYNRRRVRDRFTSEMLRLYLDGLGVPSLADEGCDLSRTWLIEKVGPLLPGTELTGEFAQAGSHLDPGR